MANSSRSDQPNILLIMCDQWRQASFGYAGDAVVHTPNIDALVAGGASLDAAYCSSPVCSPARASWLTGLYPHAHLQLYNYGPSRADQYGHRLPPQTVTLSDLLAGAGYRCGMCGPWHLGGDDQPQHGFTTWDVYRYQRQPEQTDRYLGYLAERGLLEAFAHDQQNPQISFGTAMHDGHDPTAVASIPTEHQRTSWAVDRAIEFISAHGQEQEPWFHFTSIKDPHPPLLPPAEELARYPADQMPLPVAWDDDLAGRPQFVAASGHYSAQRFGAAVVRRITAHYYALCTHIDRQVGRLFAALEASGAAANTIVVFISDHGESLGEHGLYAKRVMYEQSVRVPWVVSWPGRVAAGARLREPVAGVDLVPTLLELAGVDHRQQFHGRSLAGALTAGTEPEASPVLSQILALDPPEQPVNDEWLAATIMVRSGDWKYIRHRFDQCDELYDLAADPHELTNLAAERADVRDRLRAAIAAELRRHGPAGPYDWAAVA